MAPDTILVIDDHALYRAGVAAMLSTAFAGGVLLDCASLDEALSDVAVAPAMVLLDIQLPGRSGLEGIALIRQRWPAARIVVVAAHDEPDMVEAALACGAPAVLLKTTSPEQMITVLREMLDEPLSLPSANDALRDATPDIARPMATARQLQVLDLVGQGLSNKMIGQRFALSEHTVRGHMQAMLAALRVARRTEAMFKARQFGLIQ